MIRKPLDTAVTPMGGSRLWLVNAAIAFLIVGSAYDIIRDADHWPFSNYGMYSELQTSRTLGVLRDMLLPRLFSGELRVPIPNRGT